MSATAIDKRTHPTVNLLRTVRDGRDERHVFCEGAKLVEELLGSSWHVTGLYCVASKRSVAQALLKSSRRPGVSLSILSESVMAFCSDLDTPPGVIALALRPMSSSATSGENTHPLDVVLHGVQLPQNVGAILRVAEAAGVNRIVSTETSADFYGPKTLRSSAGSAFRLTLKRAKTLSDALNDARKNKRAILAASQHGAVSYDEWDWAKPATLILGSEGRGFSEDDLSLATHTISIPMQGEVESLNVAITAAVCLFEAARQRRMTWVK
jgi:TrmH family RNA methyltransferase